MRWRTAGLSDLEDEEFLDDEATHEAYVAFRNAKSKYRAALKERGFPQSKEVRLQQAKARSYCSVCRKKGHWHKDPECPANKGKTSGELHTTHVVYLAVIDQVPAAEITNDEVDFYDDLNTKVNVFMDNEVIYDDNPYFEDIDQRSAWSACSRTLAGRSWTVAFINHLKKVGVPYFILKQNENVSIHQNRLW